MTSYRLAPQAERDNEAILAWIHEEFGDQARIRYIESAKTQVKNPHLEANPMALFNPHAKSGEVTEAPGNGAIPILENGDRLTRAEFERRYDAMPELDKAELIEKGAILQQGIESPEHADFVARLERTGTM